MNTNRFTQLFVIVSALASILLAPISPAFAQGSIPPWECTETSNEPEPGCPGSISDPISPLDLEGQMVTLLACKESDGDPLFKVQTDNGQIVWVRVGIQVSVRTAVLENGITRLDYGVSPCYSEQDYFAPVYGQWLNDLSPSLTPGNWVDLVEPWTPTAKDKYIADLWQQFVHKVNVDPDYTFYYQDSYGKANHMLWQWWEFRSPDTFDAFYYYINGEWPLRDSSYSGKYGMNWINNFYIQFETYEGETLYFDTFVVSFAKLPPEAVVAGYLCSKPHYFMRGVEFDHIVDGFMFFTQNGEFSELGLPSESRYLAVFTENQMPSWGEMYSEIEEFPVTFKVWEICN